MCWLPVPIELTRTQSRRSVVAPHLESSERNAPWTVLLQRCCSRSGMSWTFAKILDDFRVLQFLRSQVSGAFREITSKFFVLSSHQSGHFWNLITPFYVWFLAHHREAHFLDTAVVYVSHIPLRLVSERIGMIYVSRIYVEYSSITACNTALQQ